MVPVPMNGPTAMCMPVSGAIESSAKSVKHKRRYCRMPGCTKIVKSQGLCQSHGAKPRKCKIDGCQKQAQGNFDGCCKAHFKAQRREQGLLPEVPPKVVEVAEPPAPEGMSVYDTVLPASIAWNAATGEVMPLIKHLKDGFDKNKPSAWHRNEERRARGLFPVVNPAQQLEGWERELVWMEILILTGVPGASFRHLARAWGRDKGFHMVLAQFICERRGNVERKKRAKGNGGKRSLDDMGADVADVWDDACYGDAAYNEALAADLFTFNQEHENDSAGQVVSSSDDCLSVDDLQGKSYNPHQQQLHYHPQQQQQQQHHYQQIQQYQQQQYQQQQQHYQGQQPHAPQAHYPQPYMHGNSYQHVPLPQRHHDYRYNNANYFSGNEADVDEERDASYGSHNHPVGV